MLSNQIRVLEAQICAFNVRHGMESWVDAGLESRKAVVAGNADVQVRMQRPLAILCHQDFHLTYRQVLDVLIL